MPRFRAVSRLTALALAVLALTLAFASVAFAAPTVPVLHFDDLRSVLSTAPGHELQGHMLTVVDASQDATTIPVTITGVPLVGDANQDLIMFKMGEPFVSAYGGIVAGMSGSPIYVDDGTGTDKLIGAVSYGDEFTINGVGAATPIDAMSQIETSYSASTMSLSTPVITSDGVIDRIIVAPDPQDYAAEAKTGAFVAKPLATPLFIGGLKTSSTGYKALAKDMQKRGFDVVPMGSALGGGSGSGTPFSAEMTAGAAIGAMVSRGDVWEGGIGTVTYVDGANVLAYGHPAYWNGATSLYMTNASIEGIWPSADWPYKVGDPGAIRGAITQDRTAGILGKLDVFPDDTTITATATDVDGGNTTTTAVYIPRQLFTTGFADGTLAQDAAYVAASRLFDVSGQPGSAHTTATVVVQDKYAHTYTIAIPNFTDDSADIAFAAANDVYNAVSQLQSVLTWGNDSLTIKSIDLTGAYTKTRHNATVVGVQAPNGLRNGANVVTVSLLAYGTDDTQTVTTTFNVPAGSALGGTLSAEGYTDFNSPTQSSILADMGIPLTVDSSSGREYISQIAAGLNAEPPDTAIQITFQPSGSANDPTNGTQQPSTKKVIKNIASSWPAYSLASVSIAQVNATVTPTVVPYGFGADVSGSLSGPSDQTTVTLYAQTAGSPAETLVGSVATVFQDGAQVFDFPLDGPYTTNTTFRAHINGDDTWTGADSSALLGVQPVSSLKASSTKFKHGKTITLTASVRPASAAGATVVFERLAGKKWVKFASKKLAASGVRAKASAKYRPAKGKRKVRFRFLGSTYNAPATSGVVTLKVS